MNEGPDRTLFVSERVYQTLLLAYPKRFRREYGTQMAQTFRDLCREERRQGGAGRLVRLWVRTLLDLIVTAMVERSIGCKKNREVIVGDRRLAVVGFLLVSAPLYFVSASLLKYGLGVGLLFDPLEAFLSVAQRREVFNLVSPVVFLGGLGLALALNAYSVLRLNVGREEGAVVSTVRLEVKLLNLAMIAVGFLLMVTLLGYVFLENFAYRY
ncbi:MAG: hypothetical protein WKF28_10015 [Rubrobacteraceae bacterium]